MSARIRFTRRLVDDAASALRETARYPEHVALLQLAAHRYLWCRGRARRRRPKARQA